MKTRVSLKYFVSYCSFDELLDSGESVSIHHQNVQKLDIEMFKVLNGKKPSNCEWNFLYQ